VHVIYICHRNDTQDITRGNSDVDTFVDVTESTAGQDVAEAIGRVAPHIPEASAAEVHDWLARGEAVLVDVREPEEVEEERVPGALMLPLSYLDAERFPLLPETRLVMMCAFGRRSLAAAERLRAAGRGTPINLRGGIYAWKEAGFPVAS
jgi:rhodanese-related sulfurtransferase